jgi:hypothetical protein
MGGKNSTLSDVIWNVVEIGQCWICAVLWWPFWKWRPVEIFQCQESIRDIIIYPHIKFGWHRTMLNFYHPFFMHNDVPKWFPTLKNFYRLPLSKWPPQYRTNSTLSDFNDNFGTSLSTNRSNFDDIGQCWIFTPHFYVVFWQPFWKFWKRRIAPLMVTYHYVNMWVDNDVPNWFPTLKNFYRPPFSKWPPQYRTNSTLSDFNDISYVYPHMKCRWNWTMLNLCGIVAAIFKMATVRNFSMSGINSGHRNLPTYQI